MARYTPTSHSCPQRRKGTCLLHEVTKAFGRKVDAHAWLDERTAARVTGTYVDPKSGKVTFASYYAQHAADQIWVPSTREAMDLAANSVTFGDVAFGDLKPSHIQAWLKG